MIDWVLDSGNKTGAKGDYFRKKQVKTPTQPEYYSIQTPKGNHTDIHYMDIFAPLMLSFSLTVRSMLILSC